MTKTIALESIVATKDALLVRFEKSDGAIKEFHRATFPRGCDIAAHCDILDAYFSLHGYQPITDGMREAIRAKALT
jgi:hypothetical protein